MKIILFVCFIPIPLILCAVLMNEAKPKKNLILGITLPKAAREDDAVKALCRAYRKRLGVCCAVTVLLAVPGLFLRYDSVVFTYFMSWLIPAMVLPSVPYGVYNGRLKKLKVSRGWFGEAAGLSLVDIKVAAAPLHELSAWWFLPPIAISLIPPVLTLITEKSGDDFWAMLTTYAVMAAMVVLFYFFYRIIYRQRAEVVDENTELSVALTQVRRYNWGKCWIWSAWLTGIFNLTFWIFRKDSGNSILIASLLYSAVLIAVILRVEFRTRKIQQRLTVNSGKSVYVDEDDRWKFGMFYFNPDDRHFMVNTRIGIGTTINLGKPSGRAVAVLTVLLILAMPLVGVWMMRAEFTPVSLRAEETRLVASHTSEVYAIGYSDITSAKLIYKLPSGRRTNGTGMDSVQKGSFDLDGIGPCRLCLDPRSAPFLEIEAGGRVYILGSSDSSETLTVYAALSRTAVKAPAA